MKILYIECNMGAAGDMLMGALYELLSSDEQQKFLETMNGLFNEQGISLSAQAVQKCGIGGTKMNVLIHGSSETQGDASTHSKESAQLIESVDYPEHHHKHRHEHSPRHHHHHSGYPDILHQISHLDLTAYVESQENRMKEPLSEVKANSAAVYRLIGNAEAKVHQVELEQIHFHEVGSLDALADVVGCCLLFHMLQPDQIICSPIHVGSGCVHCAHGILPVPAPATAEILKGIPVYGGNIQSELCTPTGAALLKHFSQSFDSMPNMTISKIGYGMGFKDFPQANCVRIFLGDLACIQPEGHCGLGNGPSPSQSPQTNGKEDILELSCNLDDMTGEALGFATNRLLQAGALDVFATATTMKKSRPGLWLTCLCKPEQEDELVHLIFAHTTTRGIRVKECARHVLEASFQKASTLYGEIPIKISSGYGVTRIKPEYDAVAEAAVNYDVDFQTVYQAVYCVEAGDIFI